MSATPSTASPASPAWKRPETLAYGMAGVAYALILLLILIMVGGYFFLGGGETGITVMGWLSIGLVALIGLPVLLLLVGALLGALLALTRRRDPWLALFALMVGLFLLLPAALMLPSYRFGEQFGIWNLPGPVLGLYLAVTTLVPLALVLRWFLRARHVAP